MRLGVRRSGVRRSRHLPWELGFLAGFVGVLALNAIGAHRAGRLLLIINANVCVFAGALLFTEPSGGILPFFAMAAVALLLFGPDEWLPAALGAALPAVLLAACKTGFAANLLSIHPKPAPGWYFAANAATRSRSRSWFRSSSSARTSRRRRRCRAWVRRSSNA